MARAISFRKRHRQQRAIEKLLNWVLMRNHSSNVRSIVMSWYWAGFMRRILNCWRYVQQSCKAFTSHGVMAQKAVQILRPSIFDGSHILRFVYANWASQAALSRIYLAKTYKQITNEIGKRSKHKSIIEWRRCYRNRNVLRKCIQSFTCRLGLIFLKVWRRCITLSVDRIPLFFRWRRTRCFAIWSSIRTKRMRGLSSTAISHLKESRAVKHFEYRLQLRIFVLWRVTSFVWSLPKIQR